MSESNAMESIEAMGSMGAAEMKVGEQPHVRKDIINA